MLIYIYIYINLIDAELEEIHLQEPTIDGKQNVFKCLYTDNYDINIIVII